MNKDQLKHRLQHAFDTEGALPEALRNEALARPDMRPYVEALMAIEAGLQGLPLEVPSPSLEARLRMAAARPRLQGRGAAWAHAVAVMLLAAAGSVGLYMPWLFEGPLEATRALTAQSAAAVDAWLEPVDRLTEPAQHVSPWLEPVWQYAAILSEGFGARTQAWTDWVMATLHGAPRATIPLLLVVLAALNFLTTRARPGNGHTGHAT